MPRNSSGVYSLPQAPFVPGTVISSANVNSDFSDIATALTGSIAVDGSTTISGQLKFPQGTAIAPSHTFGVDLTTGMYYVGTKKLGFTAGGVATLVLDQNNVGAGQNGALAYYGNGAILNPVGMIIDYAGNSAPIGWLLCTGGAVSRTGYPELFTIIGTQYGSGDGSTTFNLPDLRGTLTAGLDNMGGTPAGRITSPNVSPNGNTLGAAGGNQNVALITGNLPPYTPTGTVSISDPTHAHNFPINPIVQVGSGAPLRGDLANIQISTISATSSASTGITAGFTGDAQGGTSASFSVLPPTRLFNKIIFAGRP